jgi:hypothetical protein
MENNNGVRSNPKLMIWAIDRIYFLTGFPHFFPGEKPSFDNHPVIRKCLKIIANP